MTNLWQAPWTVTQEKEKRDYKQKWSNIQVIDQILLGLHHSKFGDLSSKSFCPFQTQLEEAQPGMGLGGGDGGGGGDSISNVLAMEWLRIKLGCISFRLILAYDNGNDV